MEGWWGGGGGRRFSLKLINRGRGRGGRGRGGGEISKNLLILVVTEKRDIKVSSKTHFEAPVDF